MANGTIAASQLEMLSLSGTGIITITPPATNTNRAITLPDAAGALVVSGTTPSLNGITFPATQVTSANANTLDDYEEGTFTPVLQDSSGNNVTSYSTRTGSYTKVGNIVTIVMNFVLTNKGSVSSSMRIASLPFSAAGNGYQGVGLGQTAMSGLSGTMTGGIYGSEIYLYNQAATSQTNLTGSNFTNTSEFGISITYLN
jgi:hypothetical protein